ncbi:hypothetical protein [Streptomyces sp. CS014]|uniref:hypothetical protein n=1 Tax=Streptomyces sp. CS014 TaxID=2162707 RepID=UPI000D51A518|nr:hypothetical protein [Streptomyces sp. CS014]PVD04482.1 hypothetical protein DBP12_03390 [Streptomyces sp. CS014]
MVFLSLEGTAGAGKSTIRNKTLTAAVTAGVDVGHIGQFSWLSPPATRTLVHVRAGTPTGTAAQSIRAAREDLDLHARFNLAPALARGPLIADRLILSTACLLALAHCQPVEPMIETLAAAAPALPTLTVLLTTPPHLCTQRLALRPSRPRFGEDPASAHQLAALYRQASREWTTLTGLPVIHRPSVVEADVEAIARECLNHLTAKGTP